MTSCNFGTIYTSFPIFILLDNRAIGYKWQEDRTGDRWTLKSFIDKLIPPPPQSRNDK